MSKPRPLKEPGDRRAAAPGSPCPAWGMVVQELVIAPDGNVHVPWMTPAAADLVLGLWREVSRREPPVRPLQGRVYCG